MSGVFAFCDISCFFSSLLFHCCCYFCFYLFPRLPYRIHIYAFICLFVSLVVHKLILEVFPNFKLILCKDIHIKYIRYIYKIYIYIYILYTVSHLIFYFIFDTKSLTISYSILLHWRNLYTVHLTAHVKGYGSFRKLFS